MKNRNPVFLVLLLLGCMASDGYYGKSPAIHEDYAEWLITRLEYHTFAGPIQIGSDSSDSVAVGPLPIPVGDSMIQGVKLGLEINCQYAGDLSLWLHYDCEDDGIYEASSPIEFHWARRDPRVADGGWSCPIELNGFYFFISTGWDSLEKPTVSTRPGKSGAGSGGERPSLSVFDDCPRGGSFYITIIDHGRRGGTLRSWTVYLDKPEVRTDS